MLRRTLQFAAVAAVAVAMPATAATASAAPKPVKAPVSSSLHFELENVLISSYS